jgi:hypothetical protein
MLAGHSHGAIDPDTILGAWLLDEGNGDFTEDASGNSNDGTLMGSPAWINGRSGSALGFNGSSTYVNCGNAEMLNVNVFSVSFWCNIPATQGWNHMISRGQHVASGTPGSVNWGVMMYENQATILYETFNNTGWVGINTPTTLNEWHHIVATFDGTAMQLYHDGRLAASNANAGILLDASRNFLIGARSDAGAAGGFFNGSLDEVGYFNAVVAEEDVQTIMTKGLAEVLGGSVVATEPRPANGQTDVSRDPVLSWTPGDFAATHKVYLSDNVSDVSGGAPGALIADGITEPKVAPGRLPYETTYYWRVDEVNSAPDYSVFEGVLWSFTVEPFAYPITGVTATSNAVSDPTAGPQNTVNGSGLNANDQHSIEAADMWLTAPGQESVYIQYEFDQVYKLHEMLVWNYNVQFELILGFGLKDVTVEYSENGADWVALGDVELARGTAAATYGANTTVDLGGVAARYIRLNVKSGYGVLGQFGLSEVRFYSLPVNPREPQPADGATNVDPATATLSWRAGREAASHEIHLGTDPDNLPTVGSVSEASFAPAGVGFGRTYYWQIVEVNEAEAVPAWTGEVWSFSTQEFELIEGFETYDDDIDAGTTIFGTWLDGWVNETGSTVGYLDAPFAEQRIVRTGRQSMPLTYDNTAAPFYSEAERQFETAQSWTASGADTLVLYVRGNPPVFLEQADGTIFMGSTGGDIWDNADAFRLAYKRLAGNGSIVARVDDLANTSAWAKGGVMIRETLDPGSKHAMVVVTPGNGVALQHRPTANQASLSINQTGLTAPYWVKLTRTGDSLKAERSADGVTWVSITATAADSTLTIPMANEVYIGLALVSNNAGASPTSAEFSNVSTTGNVTGSWQTQDIGGGQLASNDPAPMYVRIEDAAGKSATAVSADDSIVLRPTWQEWAIPYSELSGVNLGRVEKMVIGIGNKTSPKAGGAGVVYIDDISYGRPADR